MEGQFRAGPRVLIPLNFPAAQQFLEMRLLGGFPNSTVLAVLYAFIESLFTFHSTNAKDRLFRLLSIEIANIPYISQVLSALHQDFETNAVPRLLYNPDDLLFISSQLANRLGIDATTDYGALKACETLYTELKIKGNCYFLNAEINTSVLLEGYQGNNGEKSDVFEVNLCAGRGKIYELYKTLTTDSFLQLTCGHLMLKYDILGTIVLQAGNYSFDAASIMRLQMQCVACRNPLQMDDINQILGGNHTKSGGYQDSRNCAFCYQPCDQANTCERCQIRICPNCTVMISCTSGRPACPRCSYDFLETMSRNITVKKYLSWLQRVLDISTHEYSRQKQFEAAAQVPVQSPQMSQAPQQDLPKSQSPQQGLLENQASQQSLVQPASTGPRPGSRCGSCNKEIQGNPVLCPNQCYCATCEWQIYYYKYPTARCNACQKEINTERLGKKECSGCKRSFSYNELFCYCVACGIASCDKCAGGKLLHVMKKCLSTEKKHSFTVAKWESIGVTKSDCEVW